MNNALYSFVNEPDSKRRDLLNLAVESIDLIKRTDRLKDLRENKLMIMDALKEEISLTHKAMKHFHGIMPFNVKVEEERIQEKVERSKIKIVEKERVNKVDILDMELEDIKNKLDNLNF